MIRSGETNGKDYFFVSIEEFLTRIANNDFLEWEEVYPGSFYGTLRSNIVQGLLYNNIILDIDAQGAVSVKNQIPSSNLIFIKPPSIKELKRRLEARGTETEDSLKTRIARAEHELLFEGFFDFVYINDNFDHTFLLIKEKVLELIY